MVGNEVLRGLKGIKRNIKASKEEEVRRANEQKVNKVKDKYTRK